jgi:3-deoxy-7-phosphoheptulonate synthase
MTKLSSTHHWTPGSWQKFATRQQPRYDSTESYAQVLSTLRELPPLVAVGEIELLKSRLAEAAVGKRFLLQGGDCAERFQDCRAESIVNKLKIILQMSVILTYGTRKPVIRVGRIAGQYAKPRSEEFETVNGAQLPVYRGDIINSFAPDAEERRPDPKRLLQSYHHSSLTLNYIRALIIGGFADLHHPDHWNFSSFSDSSAKEKYEAVVHNIRDAIAFMGSLGSIKDEALGSIEFFTSHEGLLLGFEEALTRKEADDFYNLGAHMLWIGERTRQLDGGHVEYFRGIANPIGIKISGNIDDTELIQLLKAVNPQSELGKVVLITRLGATQVTQHLPRLAKAVRSAQVPVVWSCDPMHGNTVKLTDGVKTRDFSAILSELSQTMAIHRDLGGHLGGVHFEMTGENVTECIGGSAGIRPDDLTTAYETFCDPRLNYSQSLEMAFLISSLINQP